MTNQVPIDINNDTEPVKCIQCGNGTFEQVYLLRKISPILSQTKTGITINIPAFQCAKCGFLDKELMDTLYNQEQ